MLLCAVLTALSHVVCFGRMRLSDARRGTYCVDLDTRYLLPTFTRWELAWLFLCSAVLCRVAISWCVWLHICQ